ncbi:hypothetical protein ACFLU6_01190 [Acidobacteriota bacterium]
MHELTSDFHLSRTVKRAARQAIERIQGRLGDVDAGRLSLATPAELDGGLSIAAETDKQGGLSFEPEENEVD